MQYFNDLKYLDLYNNWEMIAITERTFKEMNKMRARDRYSCRYHWSSVKIVFDCNFLDTDRIFSWNTPKFSSCHVDAESGFELDNRIDMKEVMDILVRGVSLKISQFLSFKLNFSQIWKIIFFRNFFIYP